MGCSCGQNEQAHELVRAASVLVGRLTELGEVTRGNLLNHVGWSGTKAIPADGVVMVDFQVPFASVAVIAGTAAGPVTVVAAPPAAAAPTEGPGVLEVGPGLGACVPMTGNVLSLYGTPGDRVWLGVFTRPQPSWAS